MKAGLVTIIMVSLAATGFAESEAELKARVAELEKQVAELQARTGDSPATAEPAPDPSARRDRFRERMSRDRETYTREQLQEIESLYQIANRDWNSAPARASLEKLTREYPKANRTGCALLYLGQMASGDDKERYLRQAIDGYGDCLYGNGVQVGAYARFHLAMYYLRDGKKNKAEALFEEIRRDYPDAIDHRGNQLADIMPQ